MGTSLDLFDALKGICDSMNLPQEIKDMLPAYMTELGTMVSYGDVDRMSSQELEGMLSMSMIDEPSPGRSAEFDEELIGKEVVIWVIERLSGSVVRDSEVVRISGILSEISDYDVILKGGRCSGNCSVSKQMDGSIIVEREKIWQVQIANNCI